TAGAYKTTLGGAGDGFVSKINPAGGGVSDLVASTFLGRDGGGSAIAMDGAGNVYVSGPAGPGFPTTPNAYQRTVSGSPDAFVAKMTASLSTLVYAPLFAGTAYD